MTGAPTGDSRPSTRRKRDGDRGLDRSRRIVRTSEFQNIFQNGRKSVGKYVIMWKASPGAGRLGVVASRKTFRRAVDRNRAKRLMRESFRLIRADSISDEIDIVLVGRRAILDVKRQAVDTELGEMLGSRGSTK